MTGKIKLEICFDTQIQLYPLKVEQNPKGNYDVFKAKCRSFECEEYHLGEYVGPRLSYCKNSQSYIDNKFQIFYKQSDKKIFSMYNDVFNCRIKLPSMIKKYNGALFLCNAIFTMFDDSFGCLQVILEKCTTVEGLEIELLEGEATLIKKERTPKKYGAEIEFYFDFIEKLFSATLILIKTFPSFHIVRGIYKKNHIFNDEDIVKIECMLDKNTDPILTMSDPYKLISHQGDTIQKINNTLFYELSKSRCLNSFSELCCVIEYLYVVKFRMFACLDIIRNNSYSQTSISINDCINPKRIDTNYVFTAQYSRIAKEIYNIFGINDLLCSVKGNIEERIISEKTVEKQLDLACLTICSDPSKYHEMNEDEINRSIRDLLRSGLNNSKFNVNDQTQLGYSESGKRAGELDLEIRIDGFPYAIIEALVISSKSSFDSHLHKLIDNYNQMGCRNLVLICYCKSNCFEDDFSKIMTWINEGKTILDSNEIDTGYGGLKKIVGNVTHLGMFEMITVYAVRMNTL